LKKNHETNLPLISIVILNYNGLKYLRKTIPPILELDYPDYEIIVVDNNSLDDSVIYLKKIKTNTKLKLRIITNQVNYGCSIGKNIGIRNARGKYILMLDSDLLINDKKLLNKLYQNYLSLSKIAFLGICILHNPYDKLDYGRYYVDEMIHAIASKRNLIEINKIFEIKRPLRVGYVSGGAFFFNKNIWFKLGEYDESQPFNIDDFDIGARAYIFGYSNYLANGLYAIHLDIDREKNIDSWCWKYKYFFSGKCRAILKNYSLKNLLYHLPSFILFSLLKTITHSKRKGAIIWKCYFYSIIYFLNKLPDTLKHRRELQFRRKNKDDKFLKIISTQI